MEKKDCLRREDYAVPDICALIDYHSRQWLNKPEEDRSNISFAIDGEWGCGKSFVLEMVEEKLKEEKTDNGLEDRYVVFHYNCWEYDYYDEPLVAIVSMMIKQIKEELKALNNKFNEEALHKDKKYRKILTVCTVLKGAGSIALAGINHLAEEKIGIGFKDMLDEFHVTEEEIKDIYGSKEILDNINDFDPLTSFNNALNLLRKSIGIIAEDKTVVFVVDELDRCMPEYAIKVLERLHHISEGVDNLITVIAIDKSRLLDSISNAFGYDKDKNKEKEKDKEFNYSERYMKKFVNFYYPLGMGFSDANVVYKKYKSYLDLFERKITDGGITFGAYVPILFDQIDMREQEHLFEKAEMIHTIVNNDNKIYDYTVMYMELLLAVLYTYYGVNYINLYSYLNSDCESGDNLKSFRKLYFRKVEYETGKYYDDFFGKELELKIVNDHIIGKPIYSAVEKRILVWYAAFLSYATSSDGLPAVYNGISSDTSIIKEKYGIDMEENLKFLYKFYKKLESLS